MEARRDGISFRLFNSRNSTGYREEITRGKIQFLQATMFSFYYINTLLTKKVDFIHVAIHSLRLIERVTCQQLIGDLKLT